MVTIAIPPPPPSDEDDPLIVRRVIRERVPVGEGNVTVRVKKRTSDEDGVKKRTSDEDSKTEET